MGCLKYTVSIDGVPVAEHMVMEHALILVEALFQKYFEEAEAEGLTVEIKSEKVSPFADAEARP